MSKAAAVAVSSGLALMAIASATAQTRLEGKARLTDLIRTRLESQRPVRLSAETITLTGETIRLAGFATVRFDGTFVRAAEIVVNPVTKRIELIGNVEAVLGSDVAPSPPRIDFR